MLGVVVLIYALLDYLKRNEYLLVLQTASETAEALTLRWPYSVQRTALALGLALLLINGGLLTWGLALRDGEAASQAAIAPYHYFILVEELAGENVVITHFSGVFNPTDALSQRTAAALQFNFPAGQVLSLPGLNASIALASDEPVLTGDLIIELMEWIQETEYIFYDAPVVRALVGGTS